MPGGAPARYLHRTGTEGQVTIISRKFRAATAILSAALAVAATLPTMVDAQDAGEAPAEVPAAAPQGELNIPQDVQLFGPNPNFRRATAIINGDIITGTDVDQRLALILAANQGKVSDEEKQRLR